ncbi:MAG: branched-chain amino acid ABC transporter permease [Geminicoccaceae bacterium]
MLLFIEQVLNGLQFGVTLFLMASGLTLIFGIMRLINLAHGSLYMAGAYVAATVSIASGGFLVGLVAGVTAAAVAGFALERLVMRRLYRRDHLDQVLATFAIILMSNEAVSWIWGRQPLRLDPPSWLQGTIELVPGAPYPAYRLAVILVGLAVVVALFLLIQRTRLGMWIRAGSENRGMLEALGVDVGRVFAVIFALGAAFAGLAGVMAGPFIAIEPGMGEQILILTFVVVVIGGLGSVTGASVGALLVGLTDTLGRVYLPSLLRTVLPASEADVVGASLAAMTIYLVMAVVLTVKPTGLFGRSE